MWPIALGLGLLFTSVFSLQGCKSRQPVTSSPPSDSTLTTSPSISPSQQLLGSQNVPVCHYRDSLREGQPFDYHLWQGERTCSEISCAPEPPPIFTTCEEISTFESQSVRPAFLNRLPSDELELMVFLDNANLFGQITWVSDSNSEIYDLLQTEIDSALPGQDVHLVFGFAHRIVGQSAFFNELLTEGEDGRKINGITHLALEFERVASDGTDIQNLLDHYLVTGNVDFRPRIHFAPGDNINYPAGREEEIKARNYLLQMGHDECYNIVLADILDQTSVQVKELLGNYYWLGAREIYAVERVGQRQDLAGRDVVFWGWGANHAEKHRLPFYIRNRAPEAKVVSVVFNGGTYVPALAFDRALEYMGWLEKTFILKLDGYRDADYVIHLPTNGRRVSWGMRGNPVVNQLFEPPQ